MRVGIHGEGEEEEEEKRRRKKKRERELDGDLNWVIRKRTKKRKENCAEERERKVGKEKGMAALQREV